MIDMNFFLKNVDEYYKCQKLNKIEDANLYAKKIFSFKDELLKSKEYKILDSVIYSVSEMAQIWICGFYFDFKYREEEAKTLLLKLANSEDEIVSKNAKMSLFVRCDLGNKKW